MTDDQRYPDASIGAFLERAVPGGHMVQVGIRDGRAFSMINGLDGALRKFYRDGSICLRDPIVTWGLENTGRVDWMDSSLHDPANFLAMARKEGFRSGIGLSIATGPVRSIATLLWKASPPPSGVVETFGRWMSEAHEETVSRCVEITPGQAEALVRLASGDRLDKCAFDLGISSSALKLRLKAARKKLGARTTAEAVYRATRRGLI